MQTSVRVEPHFLRFCGKVLTVCLRHNLQVIRWIRPSGEDDVVPFCREPWHEEGLAVDLRIPHRDIDRELDITIREMGLQCVACRTHYHVEQPRRVQEERPITLGEARRVYLATKPRL